MKKILFIFAFSYSLFSVHAQNRINKYEYWYDNNYSGKTQVSITPVNQLMLNTSLPTGGLNDGIHLFTIRFRDDSARWSSTVSGFFFKGGYGKDTQRKIAAWEYRIDNGTSLKTTLGTQVTTFNLDTSVDLSAISPGLHNISLRFQDHTGLWSSSVNSFFFKTEQQVNTTGDSVVLAEYWIDNNYAKRITEAISPANQVTWVKQIDFSTIPDGVHQLTVRFRDSRGFYSAASSGFFYKMGASAVSTNLINAYRYWFDDADTAIRHVNLSTPVNPYELNASLDMSRLWKGIYRVHFQFRDLKGQWSVAVTDTFEKMANPLSDFSLDKRIFCDSGTVTFKNLGVDYDTVHWDFGDGQYSSAIHPVHVFKSPGKYVVSLWVKDKVSGLEHTYATTDTVIISPTPVFSLGNDRSYCANAVAALEAINGTGYTWTWNTGAINRTLTPLASGSYWCKTTDQYGCKYSDTVNIVINPLPISAFGYNVNLTSVVFSDSSKYSTKVWWKFGDGSTADSSSNPTHVFPAIGQYTVTQYARNQCGIDSSKRIIQIQATGIGKNLNGNQITVFPNPVQNILHFKWSSIPGRAVRIEIFTSTGQRVFYTDAGQLKEKQFSCYIGDLPDGEYRVAITSGQDVFHSLIWIIK